MDIISLISNSGFIVVSKQLLKLLGLNATILLGELASEYEYWKNREETEDGYFFSTIENVEENTSLTRYQQTQSLNVLIEQGLIDVKVKGIPARRYIKINEEKLLEMFTNKFVRNLQTSMQETNKLDVKKLARNNNKEIIIKNNNKDISTTKHKFGEYQHVLLTDKEYEKLQQDFSNCDELIKYLDEYIEMKGYKAKSHNLAIRKWVVEAVDKEHQKKTSTPYRKFEYNEAAIEERNRRVAERIQAQEQADKLMQPQYDKVSMERLNSITKNMF